MHRKHFRVIAESFNRTKPLPDNTEAYGQWCRDVTNLAGNLRQFNDNFDQQLFLNACGYSALERFSVL